MVLILLLGRLSVQDAVSENEILFRQEFGINNVVGENDLLLSEEFSINTVVKETSCSMKTLVSILLLGRHTVQ